MARVDSAVPTGKVAVGSMGRLRRWIPTGRSADLLALACFALGALYVTVRLWVNIRHRIQSDNVQDQIFFEWVLARAARVVTHLENPFFTTALNYPSGVNMIANTSVLGIGIPLTPITLLFGPQASYTVMLSLALAGTAAAWYYVLSRHFVTSQFAAFVGAAFCGFGPAMVSHANGHPNIISQFVVPFIVLNVIKLREPGRTVRTGVTLGLLIAYQVFINEEILFFTALATGLFVTIYALQRRDTIATAIRPFLAGMALAATVTGVLVAYPLYVQFFGPQHYQGLEHWFQLSTDLSTYTAFARRSIAQHPVVSPGSVHPAEENAFLGWPLVILCAILVIWMWRDVVVRSVAIVGMVFVALSLGSTITVSQVKTGIPGPWALLDHLPIFEAVVPVRLGLVTVPIVGLLLAFGVEKFLDRTYRPTADRITVRLIGLLALAAALLPIAPVPLLARYRDTAPEFITAGGWQAYTHGGHTVVPVPLPTYPEPTGMSWSAQAGIAFPIPWGYFLGPKSGVSGDVGDLAPPALSTPILLARVDRTGHAANVTAFDKRQAREDLRRWNAGVVVLDTRHKKVAPLKQTLDDLLGTPGTERDGVWLWDVRQVR